MGWTAVAVYCLGEEPYETEESVAANTVVGLLEQGRTGL